MLVLLPLAPSLPLGVLLLAAVPVAPLSPLRVLHAFSPVGRYAAGDRGVDLAGTPGEPVRSAVPGTVTFAGPVGGRGVVSVQVGAGRVLTYEPVSPAVRAGTTLGTGQVLGQLVGGWPGCPAAACLHWGLRLAGGAYGDPMTVLGPPQVRLLPLPPLSGPAATGAGPVTAVTVGRVAAAPAPAVSGTATTADVRTAATVTVTGVVGLLAAAPLRRRRRAGRGRRSPPDLRS